VHGEERCAQFLTTARGFDDEKLLWLKNCSLHTLRRPPASLDGGAWPELKEAAKPYLRAAAAHTHDFVRGSGAVDGGEHG
jgi:hypothetical protein